MKKAMMMGVAAAVAGVLGAQSAWAQSLTSGQGVADRPRADYDPIGTRAGAFTIYPSITSTVDATNNYLATNTDKRGDVYLTVHPEAVIRSDMGRSQLTGRLFLDQSVHANLSGENATQFGGSVAGGYEPAHDIQLHGDLSAARYVESRSSLGAYQLSQEPVHFEQYHASIGGTKAFNDLTLGLDGSVDDRNYQDTRLPDGTPIDQDFRDVRSSTISASGQYSLRNGIGLIVSGSYENDHYLHPLSPSFGTVVDRDSSGWNLQGGVTLELSRLIFGTIQIGYLNRNYRDPQLSDFSGLSFNADLLWNVTTLTTLRFRASRTVQDTSSAAVAGNTVSDFRAYVDHELYRYVILSADIGYEHFRPNGSSFVTVGGDQVDVGAGVRYLIDRRFSLTANGRYIKRTSDSTFLRYSAVIGSVGFRVQF